MEEIAGKENLLRLLPLSDALAFSGSRPKQRKRQAATQSAFSTTETALIGWPEQTLCPG